MKDLISCKTAEESRDTQKAAVIAILGRPNVGKSTLYNRLLRKRKAITDPTPGVTRDPLEAEYLLEGRKYILIDTGGVKLNEEGLDGLITDKSLQSADKANLIILVLDVTELTPEDEIFIEHLRPHTQKIILVVNKADNRQRTDNVWNYYSLGFEKVLPVSASHGLGIEELEEAIADFEPFRSGAAETENKDDSDAGEYSVEMEDSGSTGGRKKTHRDKMRDKAGDKMRDTARGMDHDRDHDRESSHENALIRIAIMGKPNTGKSTLTNLLLGKDASIVSEVPGTTRDVVIGDFGYKGRKYQVLDTAGIRRKKKVGENIEYYSVTRAFRAIDEADIIFLMIDVAEGLTEQDKKIASQIVKKGKGVILVLNKWDLVKKIPSQMEAIKERVRFLFPVLAFAPLVPLSSLSGEGLEKLMNTVNSIWGQLNRRVETSKLNSAVKRWVQKQEPPRGKRGHYKVFYSTQVSSKPVQFLFFVNRKNDFPQAYIQYLTNSIRKDLGFPSIPLSVELKERQ